MDSGTLVVAGIHCLFFGRFENQIQSAEGVFKYALTLYDDFKEAYDENMTLEEILSNLASTYGLEDEEREVLVFNDVDYVEGCWSKNNHINTIVDDETLKTNQLNAIKLGARANDDYYSRMIDHPLWHGYWCKKNENGEYSYATNYITAYIYATECAKAFNSTGTYKSPEKLSYMTDNEYNNMKGLINNTTIFNQNWSTVLGNNNITNVNKKFFTYGVALHIATDAFAHSTYTARNNKSYINHELGADDISKCENRYNCAQKIAKNLFTHAANDESGTIKDFYNVANTTYDGTFYMRNYNYYINKINSVYYNERKDVLDNISYTSVSF